MTKRTWWSGSTRCSAASAGPPVGGGSTGWPRSSTPRPARSSGASHRSPSTTASASTRAHPGTGLVGGHVQIRWRLGEPTATFHAHGRLICTHRLAPRGAQQTIRLPEHTAALEKVVLAEFTSDRPCKRKVNRPPSDTALALAAELLGEQGTDPVIDLDIYRRILDGEETG
jgi:hypothetical protein